MLSASRILLSFMNIIIFINGISQIFSATYFNDLPDEIKCSQDASWILWMGVFIVITSIVGIMAPCCKLKAMESIYKWVIMIVMIATVVFTIFIFVTLPNKPAVKTYQDTSQHGFWLNEFSTALQKALVNEKEWKGVKTCYAQKNLCDTLRDEIDYQTVDFIEIGCCSPPNRCGLMQRNITRWVAPETGLLSNDDECEMWMRVGTACYDCDSCKAGYLTNYQEEWDENIVSNISSMVLLIATSAIACYAFREDNPDHDDNPKQGRNVYHHEQLYV